MTAGLSAAVIEQRRADAAGVAPPPLSARGVKVAYDGRAVLDHVDLALESGTVTALCGPNGSGKSTLLRVFAGLTRPEAGEVLVAGRAVGSWDRRALARRLAVLPQSPEVPEGVRVDELVALGRFPYRGLLRRDPRADAEAVDRALDLTGLAPFRERRVETLSGGERQRAWLAMILAQGGHTLLLDEPTTYLDPQHQEETLRLVRRLNRELGLTVVWVLHDLNQAASYSDRMVMLHEGRVAADDRPDAVLTEATVRRVFALETLVIPHPESGRPLCVPRHEPLGDHR